MKYLHYRNLMPAPPIGGEPGEDPQPYQQPINVYVTSGCGANGAYLQVRTSVTDAISKAQKSSVLVYSDAAYTEQVAESHTQYVNGAATDKINLSIANATYYVRVYAADTVTREVDHFVESCTVNPPTEPDPEDPVPPVVPCVASKAFTIAPSRYARFIMDFKDLAGRQHIVKWLQIGYAGEPEYILGSGTPLRIEYPGTSGKIGVLSGSGATIDLVVEREGLMEDLYTVDEREYLVEHTIDDQLNWRGYHMADVYNEPWVSVPFHATVQAYDGLGALKNKPYVDENGVRYYGRARSIEVLFRCLRTLDLNLPVWIAINLWEDQMNPSIEPLAQAYVDQGAYYNEDNEPLDCEEVVTRILQPYNAFVKQASGSLHIIRYTETNGPYSRRKAEIGLGDTQVVFDITKEDFEQVYTILQVGPVSYRESVQVFGSKPAYKYVTTITNYGEYENFIYNGDFERWVNDVPAFWEFNNMTPVAGMLSNKFVLAFTDPVRGKVNPARRTRNGPRGERYFYNTSYPYKVFSETGFTYRFDYTVVIDDFVEKPGMEWVIYPEFEVEGQIVRIINEAQALFNGVEVNYPLATPRIGGVSPGPGNKRIDILYARPDGTYEYEGGTSTTEQENDIVRQEPDDTLLVSYFTWEGENQPSFSSASSFVEVGFSSCVRIGAYQWGDRREEPIPPPAAPGRTTIGGTVTGYNNTKFKSISARWYKDAEGDEPLLIHQRNITGLVNTRLNGFANSGGYAESSGTFEVQTLPLMVPGLPSVLISNAHINRDNLRGVTIYIDNVVLQQTDNGTEKMLITGENPGHINTPPFSLDLHHGSGIPRTEALLTLADGTPTGTWGGFFLQERTARDILAQHTRASLILSASLAGPVTPITILKDIHRPNARFLVDKYTYDAKNGLTQVEALEIFGGIEDVLSIPEKAMLYEDRTAMLYEDGTYMLYE